MRILIAHRDPESDYARHAAVLADLLNAQGLDAVVDDASPHVPKETGWRFDRKASKWLKDAVKGFDILHCMGYRMAWAASEALYVGFPWLYSALEAPNTTNPLLIDRLNAARRGICATPTIKNTLDQAETLHLSTHWPPTHPPDESDNALQPGLTLDLSRVAPAELDDWEPIATEYSVSKVHALLLCGNRAYSYRAAEAMAGGTVVIARSGTGIEDLVEHERSGILINTPREARHAIADLENSPEFASTISAGAKERAQSLWASSGSISRVVNEYRRIQN